MITLPCATLRIAKDTKRALLLALSLSLVTACGGSGDSPPSTGTESAPAEGTSLDGSGDSGDSPPSTGTGSPTADLKSLPGSVIDGPVAGAIVSILDANGELISEAQTDSAGRFTASFPADAAFPFSVIATGGTNLTTDAPPGFTLSGLVAGGTRQEVILNPLSSLALQRAECIVLEEGEPEATARAAGIARLLADPVAELAFLETYGFGLNAGQRAALIDGGPTTPADAASLLLASEVLAESLRRATAALNAAGITAGAEGLLTAIACDLEDGELNGSSARSDAQFSAAFLAAATAVLAEASLGELQIAGSGMEAVAVLEQAVRDTFDFEATVSLADLPIGAALHDQLLRTVHAALAATPSPELFDLFEALQAASGATRSALDAEISDPSALRTRLAGLPAEVLADLDSRAVLFEQAARKPDAAIPPGLSFEASPRDLSVRGGSTTLDYAATQATTCRQVTNGVAAWTGTSGPQAVIDSGAINRNEEFTLICAGLGGFIETTIPVTIPPDIQLRFLNAAGEAPGVLELGEDVRIAIDVVDAAEERCTFERSDQVPVSPNDVIPATPGITVTVRCSGSGGQEVLTAASLPVRAARLSWTAPTERVDGTLLEPEEITGYRIYHGTEPGEFGSAPIAVAPDQLSHVQAFPPGVRHFVVTATAIQATNVVESLFSEEVSKRIP